MDLDLTNRHRLSAKGKRYVDILACLDHECCVEIAPDLFKMDNEEWGAYVIRQPETEEEKSRFKEAMDTCPVEAIRDDG